jgi:hypothetical protein
MGEVSEEAEFKLSYALAKQIDSVHSLETSYGTFHLDEAMRKSVASALRPILQTRLSKLRLNKKKEVE